MCERNEKLWLSMATHCKNRNGLHTIEGYQLLLPIIRYKHWKYQRGFLTMSYLDMYTKIQKRIETRMETIITYSKGRHGRNEAFHPSVCLVIHPIIHPVIHPWMASYNNPLQCEGWKTLVVLQFAKS